MRQLMCMNSEADEKMIDYPEQTQGSATMSRLRSKMNNLSDAELANHYAAARARIYGGTPVAQASGAGH